MFYNPQVTCNRDGLTQRAPAAVSIKCHAVYPTPFWRQAGLSGVVFSDLHPVQTVQDNSPPGTNPTPGILVAFIGGDDARAFSDQSEAAVQAAVLANLTTYFGSQAADPVQFFQANWIAQPFREDASRGTSLPACGRTIPRRCGPRLAISIGPEPRPLRRGTHI
jgi:monoamine oxidase